MKDEKDGVMVLSGKPVEESKVRQRKEGEEWAEAGEKE